MSKELPVRYHLEIYCQGEGDKPIMAFDSGTPFMAVSKGDKITTKGWEYCSHLGQLEVTGVEHIIWEIKDSHIGHKVMVDTKRCS